jgi:hypothetical protein
MFFFFWGGSKVLDGGERRRAVAMGEKEGEREKKRSPGIKI